MDGDSGDNGRGEQVW